MNSIKAITQLEELKRDRLSFIQNDESDEIYLKDIKAISLAIKALKKCPDIQDKSFNCRLLCEKKYLNDVYRNQQLTMDTILKERRGNNGK